MRIIGIDPGLSGGIAILDDLKIFDVFDMPIMSEGKKNKNQLNSAQLVNIIRKNLIPNGNTFLISEVVRGEGAILKTISGKRFMTEYHHRAELAPRDIVARSIAEVVNETGDDYVFLDCQAISEKEFENQFPTIKENCQKMGINPPKD